MMKNTHLLVLDFNEPPLPGLHVAGPSMNHVVSNKKQPAHSAEYTSGQAEL